MATEREIVINRCYGGFSLSDKAVEMLKARGVGFEYGGYWTGSRDDKDLVDVVRKLGDAASGDFSKLEIISIPADVDWHIDDNDGFEWVAENHRTWG